MGSDTELRMLEQNRLTHELRRKDRERDTQLFRIDLTKRTHKDRKGQNA